MKGKRFRVMIMGPLPPPYGGLPSIISLLKEAEFEDTSIQIVETTLKNPDRSSRLLSGRILFGGRMLSRLVASLIKHRPGAMVCFSSAYTSFWEKATWAEVARLFGVRTAVVMVDGNFVAFEQRLGKFRRRIMNVILRRYEVVGVQSEGWLRYYRKLCPLGRYSIVTGGVDPKIFAPSTRASLNGETTQVLYVGWMIKEKGVYDLLEAAALIKNEGLKFQIRLIGPLFDQEPQLRKVVAAANLEDCVNIVGTVSKEGGVAAEYQAADLFVLPSYAEGFPNSILEAMAAGLPVVATAVGAVPEIVDDEITGLLVPPGDPAKLAAALSMLIKDSSSRQKMSQAARRKVLTNYTLDHSVASYQRLFGRLHREDYATVKQNRPEGAGASGH